jgi:hypothetical protein
MSLCAAAALFNEIKLPMPKITAFLTLLLIPFASTFAQDPSAPPIIEVDYKMIEKVMADPAAAYFFPKLKARYDQNDSTLTVLDYHYFYYGYTFQEEYNSMKRNDNVRSGELKRKDELSDSELQELFDNEVKWLQEMPIDLESIYWVLVALDGMGKQQEFLQWKRKFDGLMDAVIASGDGLTKETAIHVATVRTEYFLLNMFGFEYADEQQLFTPCDYLKIEKNDAGIEGLYFNVERHFACMRKLFGGDKKD